MSEISKIGCALWSIWVTAFFIIFMAFAGGDAALVHSTIPASPPPTPTLMTTVAPDKTDAYFAVENNQIHYAYRPTLGKPCYYLISGHVLDLNGNPYTNFVVNIKMIELEGVGPEGPGYAFPGEGGFAEDGPSGWGMMLPQWQVAYEIWLTTTIGGEELSPHVLIPARDCDYNRAIVNFVQIRPWP